MFHMRRLLTHLLARVSIPPSRDSLFVCGVGNATNSRRLNHGGLRTISPADKNATS